MFNKAFSRHIIRLLACCLLLFISCRNDRFRAEYDLLKSSKIIIPENLLVLDKGGWTEAAGSLNDCGIRLIHFVSQHECSECAIASLSGFEKLYELSMATNRFKLIIIVSIPTDIAGHMMQVVKREYTARGFKFPLYIDSNDDFLLANAFIPTNGKLHSFVIDESGTPILIGNPLENKKIWLLFSDLLYGE